MHQRHKIPVGSHSPGVTSVDRLDRRRQHRTDHEETRDYTEFQDTYRSLSDRVERFLMQVVILGLVVLALVQTLHTNSTARRMLSLVEGLEGVPWNQVAAWNGDVPETVAASSTASPLQVTVVSMSRREAPDVKLLVDGKVAGTFASGSVTAKVRPGQVVSVDGTASAQSLTFRVVGPPTLVRPALGSSVVTQGSIQSLGVVESGRR